MNYETMSKDIKLVDKTGNVETMSGDIDLKNHKDGKIETMSGDISVTSSELKSIDSMSGDIDLDNSIANKISTMSGDIYVKNSKVNHIETMSGEVSLENSEVSKLNCNEWLNISNSTIEHLIFNPLNNINIICNSSGIFSYLLNLLTKKSKDTINFTIPSNCTIDKVTFNKCTGTIRSEKDVEVIGGEFIKI